MRGHLEALHCWDPDWLDGWTIPELTAQHINAHDQEEAHRETPTRLYDIAFPHERTDLTPTR